MKIVHHISELVISDSEHELVGLTIGNFDGVHLGHRDLLSRVKRDCIAQKYHMAVMTFVPHPHFIIDPSRRHFLLNSYRERRALLSDLGVDFLVEMPFTRDFSIHAPEDFLSEDVFSYPQVHHLYLGHDFAFGRNKQGNFDFVRNYLKTHRELARHCTHSVMPEFLYEGKPISSSTIRALIEAGDMEAAMHLLGRHFFVSGPVIRGKERGRTFGFPTANLQISDERVYPSPGVYVTKVKLSFRDTSFLAATNVGLNPTFDEGRQLHVEAHILDFDEDLYGEDIMIEFCHKLRDEKKFSSAAQLVEQIRRDVEMCRKYKDGITK